MKFLNISLMKVNFTLNREFKAIGDEVTYSPDLAFNHEVKTEEKQLIVLLGVRQISGDLPYYFEIESAGLFQFDEFPEERMLTQFIAINCPAIMFPYVRETIADLTRRAGFSPLHLNPINFIQLAKDRETEKQAPTN